MAPADGVLNSRVPALVPRLTAGVLSLKLSVSSATLRLDERIHSFQGLGFAHMLLHHLATAGADPPQLRTRTTCPNRSRSTTTL